MLFVFAAGNDDQDNDLTPQGPCQADQVGTGTYTANNVLCVTATDQADNLASFSNFGATGVDLAAPGTQILSTSARRIFFTDDFETDDFATRWTPSPGSDWARTNEAPLTSFGVSDSPGGNYAGNTEAELTSEHIHPPGRLQLLPPQLLPLDRPRQRRPLRHRGPAQRHRQGVDLLLRPREQLPHDLHLPQPAPSTPAARSTSASASTPTTQTTPTGSTWTTSPSSAAAPRATAPTSCARAPRWPRRTSPAPPP